MHGFFVFLGRSARLECAQISSLTGLRILLSLTNLSSINWASAPKKKKRAEQNEIEREMGGEAPVFARITEAAAGDVESADFCGHGGDDEGRPNRVAICVCRRAKCLPRSN
jgi:hypothetical protein